jgi:hypothetical protein
MSIENPLHHEMNGVDVELLFGHLDRYHETFEKLIKQTHKGGPLVIEFADRRASIKDEYEGYGLLYEAITPSDEKLKTLGETERLLICSNNNTINNPHFITVIYNRIVEPTESTSDILLDRQGFALTNVGTIQFAGHVGLQQFEKDGKKFKAGPNVAATHLGGVEISYDRYLLLNRFYDNPNGIPHTSVIDVLSQDILRLWREDLNRINGLIEKFTDINIKAPLD